MAEEIAAASVRIIPDFSTFDAQVLAHAQQAARTIETALAKVKTTSVSATGFIDTAGLSGAATTASTNIDKVTKSTVGLDAAIKNTNKNVQSLSSTLGQAGRFLVPLTLAFSALAVKAVQASSAIVEAVNAVNVAFGESSGEILIFARNLQETDTFFGLTERAALDAAATFGLFLNDIVKSEPVLANLSEQLITAAADVGSLFNVNTNKVIQDFQSGLAGQTRTVRKYGLDISEAATKQEAFRLGLVTTGEELNEEEKRISRLSLLLHGSAVAAGDAELTQNTFAGALRNTQVALGGAIDQLGQQLLPVAQRVLEVVGGLATAFSGLSGFSQRLIIGFGAIAAAIGPVFLIVSKLLPIFEALVPAVQGFIAAAAAGTLTLGPIVAGLALLTAGIVAFKFALDAPTNAEQTAAQIQQLAKDSQTLKNSTDQGSDSAKKYKKALEDLGLKDADFTNFTTLDAAIKKINDDLENPPKPKEDTKGFGILKTLGVAEKALTAFEKDFLGTGVDIFATVLGEKPEKGEKQVDLTAQKIGILKTQIQAKNQVDAQQAIASERDLNVRAELQKAYDEEIKLQAERTLKQNAANKAADEAIQAAIDQLDPTERLNKLFAESVENLNNLLQAQTAVTAAEKSIRSAKTSLGNAQERFNKLTANGTKLTRAQSVDLQKLKDAEDAMTDATNKRIAAEQEIVDLRKELVELEKPATAEELVEATDKITAAQIKLAQATRAREAAEKDLEPRTKARLNLAGLTLDQLRLVLANERATLKATREQKAEEGATKAETATLAAIAERDAQKDLTDAQKNLTEVQKKGSAEDQKVIDKRQELARATTASAKAAREELDAREKLNTVKAGDPDFETKVADARQAIADASENLKDAEQRLRDAQIKRGEQELILAGNVNAGNIALAARLALNKDLLQQEKNNEIFVQQFETLLANSGLFPHPRGPGGNNVKFPTIHEIALSLINDPNSPFREVFKILNLPPFAEGAVLDRPTIGIFGEAGREGVIPFTKPKRAATLLVGAREFPAIEAEIAKIRMVTDIRKPTRTGPRDFGGLTLDRPSDSEAIGVLRSILERLELAAGVKIDVHPTPGMSESQLARKVAREMGRYWGTP